MSQRVPSLLAVLLAGVVLFGQPGRAGGKSEPDATLNALLEIAMRDNPRILAAHAAYLSMKERVAPAGALPDPMLMFAAEGAPLTTPSPTNAERGKVTLTQMFPFPGKQGLMKSSMAEEAKMARAELLRTRLEVASDLHAAFYELDRIRRSIDLLGQTRTSMQLIADIARTRYATGKAEQMDMLKAQVELAQESNKLAIMRTQLPAAVAKVNALLGREAGASLGEGPAGGAPLGDQDPETPGGPAGAPAAVPSGSARGDAPSGALTASVPGLPSIDDLEQRALVLQPMLQMKDSGVRKAEVDARLAKREGLPDFTLGIEYMNMKEMPDAWTGMAGLTLPIWRGNKVGPNRRAAEQALAAARAERTGSQNDVLFMVREAYAMAAASRETVSLYRESILPQAEASLASSKAAYETGRAGFLDLLEAQRMLLDSEMGYLDATADYLKGRAALGLAVGDPEMLGVDHE